MQSFDEAQKALADFDAKYWSHKKGMSSVRHTYTHLMEGIARALDMKKGNSPDIFPFHHALNYGWEEHLCEDLSGKVMEHAIRIANNMEFSIYDLLMERLGHVEMSKPTIQCWAEVCNGIRKNKFHPYYQNNEEIHFHNLVLTMIAETAQLSHACEYYDHTAKIRHYMTDTLHVVVGDLMKWSAVFGPVGKSLKHNFSEGESIEMILEPFKQRLDNLYGKMSSHK